MGVYLCVCIRELSAYPNTHSLELKLGLCVESRALMTIPPSSVDFFFSHSEQLYGNAGAAQGKEKGVEWNTSYTRQREVRTQFSRIRVQSMGQAIVRYSPSPDYFFRICLPLSLSQKSKWVVWGWCVCKPIVGYWTMCMRIDLCVAV